MGIFFFTAFSTSSLVLLLVVHRLLLRIVTVVGFFGRSAYVCLIIRLNTRSEVLPV